MQALGRHARLVFLLAVACTTTSGSSRGISSVDQYCHDRIRKADSCGTRYEGDERCAAIYDCSIKMVRPEVAPALLSCAMEEGCKERSEECQQPKSKPQLSSNPKWEDLKPLCARKKAECPDYKVCNIEKLEVASNLALEIVKKCLESPCAEVEKCNLKHLFEAVPACADAWGFAPGNQR